MRAERGESIGRILGGTVLGVGVALLGWRFPFAGLGWMEAIFSTVLPYLWLRASFSGRRLAWTYLGIFLSLMGVFSWVARTIEVKGNQPYAVALLGTSLFYLYEALGLLAVVALARLAHRRAGAWAAGFTAAGGVVAWELFGFHVYQWGWGSTLAGIPWFARAAAFVTTYGLSALVWGCTAATASLRAEGRGWTLALRPLALGAGLLLGLGWAWMGLPRGPERMIDVVMVQPNFPPGERLLGMEEEMWARSDRILAGRLPRPGVATLLLWPESAVLGRDDFAPEPRLQEEARRRGVSWIFGSEGGRPEWKGQRYPLRYNLVRGEAGGQPSFVQAKTEPMPFGERMPGPPGMRAWLDRVLGFGSAEPGELGAGSSFAMPTPQGTLRIHPLICSEALMPVRVQEGVALAGADLLANLTNDGWFDRSVATDLHAVQIRLRSVEMGVPLLRCTLTGKSGVFREDGRWALWGAPMTEAGHAFTLAWSPVRTPARSPWVRRGLLLFLGAGALLLAWRGRNPAG
ncbi:MAG: apolipoprotein N-acyltransferase [Acidobacteria bacterium]|nr:apolipoprotein N-acyltransferase [Acidobacteriota bacterium]